MSTLSSFPEITKYRENNGKAFTRLWGSSYIISSHKNIVLEIIQKTHSPTNAFSLI